MEKNLNQELSSNSQEDLKLIGMALENNPKAYEKLMKKYKKSVYYLVLKMVHKPLEAEDLTQDTFAKAFKSLHQYNGKHSFCAWLFRIATNATIDFLRRKKIETISYHTNIENEDEDDEIINFKDRSYDPNESLMQKQRKEMIEKVINALPGHFKEMVILRFYKELSYEEISETLGVPLGTVKAKLFKCRALLEEAFRDMKDQV